MSFQIRDGGDDLRMQFSDIPDSATWRAATVIARTTDTGIAECADGSRVDFTNGKLLRNRTHVDNTQVGDHVWVTERGGISAHPPDMKSPRERFDEILREQVNAVARAVDRRLAEDIR